MPVTTLELENFKSYAGKQSIGPFKNFTSIIGPNGSGKSNIMDALSFVLGVQSKDLRSSQMKELIYRPPGKQPQPTSASAALIYEDEEPDEDGSLAVTKFQRVITKQGVGQYLINGKKCSYDKYEEALGSIGVLVKARNFLVFQGDVESIARKSPTELVALLENISQSAQYKDAYQQAQAELKEAEDESLFAYNKQKTMKHERRILKDQKEEAERFEQLLDAKQQLQTDLYLWQLYHMDMDRQERQTALEEVQQELEEKQEEEQEHNQALKEAKKKASAARRATQAADKIRIQKAGEVDKLEPSMIKSTEEISAFKKKLEKDEAALSKKKEAAESHQETLESLETELTQAQTDKQELEEEYEAVKRDVAPDQVTLTPEQEEEYERVREAAATASVEPRRRLTTCQRQLESARAKAANDASELDKMKKRKAEVSKQVKEFADRSEKLKKVSHQKL